VTSSRPRSNWCLDKTKHAPLTCVASMLESSRQASRSPLKGLTQTGAILMKFALRFLLLGLPFIIMLDISRAENLPEFRPDFSVTALDL